MSKHQQRKAADEDSPVVLVVDDEELVLKAFSRLLRRSGLTVIEAPSALHALDVLAAQRVDLVLTDQWMKGPTGLDLLATVALRWPKVRRVLMSAVLDHELALETRGHHRVLPKDLGSAMISEIINREARRDR